MAEIDLSRPRRLHIVGVGGAGMSAIATVLVAMGHQVSGSDLKASAALERLQALGVDARVGHDGEHVHGADVVVASTAVPPTNLEIREATRLGIPVCRRAEALAAIAAVRRSVAVSGTHGKTTTSSMLSLILTEAGMHPSFIIGGDINEVGSGAAWGDGDWLVVEADESDGTFLELAPEVAVVTNIEADHLDHYGSLANLESAFGQFLAGAAGGRVVCGDDPVAARLAAELGATTYGLAEAAAVRIVAVERGRASSAFDVVREGTTLGRVELAVPGLHNVRNACGALVAAMQVGAPFAAAQRALARYGGVARRFEFRGEREGITYVDDYAHLPSEVAAAIAAAGDGRWARIVAVFQPHRYSRTASLWRGFADAFEGADLVVLTDVYGAGEAPRPGVNGRLLATAVREAHPDQAVQYVSSRSELPGRLRSLLRPGDLCLTMGAGDLTLLPDELLEPPA